MQLDTIGILLLANPELVTAPAPAYFTLFYKFIAWVHNHIRERSVRGGDFCQAQFKSASLAELSCC